MGRRRAQWRRQSPSQAVYAILTHEKAWDFTFRRVPLSAPEDSCDAVSSLLSDQLGPFDGAFVRPRAEHANLVARQEPFMKRRNQTILRDTFRTSITLKGVDGVLEIIGGILLWFVHPSAMNPIVRMLSLHDLSHDRRDIIRAHLLHTTQLLQGGNKMFASIYLLTHGATKAVLVIALWMNAVWAYPLTIVVFTAFSAYQMYRYSFTHSIAMLLLTIFDLAIICLTWLQWQEQKVPAGDISSNSDQV